MADIRLGGPVNTRIQDANMAKMRAQIRRRDVASYVAQGYSINHPELQARLAAARSEEEVARILLQAGINP